MNVFIVAIFSLPLYIYKVRVQADVRIQSVGFPRSQGPMVIVASRVVHLTALSI